MEKQTGFTLIELLVVIAVIVILASMIGLATGGSRIKARDARRLGDMRSLVTAQELYYSDMNRYFTCSATAGDCNPRSARNYPSSLNTRMPKTPVDPRNYGATCTGDSYIYCGLDNTLDNQQYCYFAKLEENNASFITASPKGYMRKDAIPTSLSDCGVAG
jgi:prepilin-type N-terminal cleavage/methylation domain-containing protein